MNDKRSNYLFTILFIISIIYTTLRLFSLQDDLILSSQVLDSSQIASLSPVLLQLYIAVGITILTGVIVLAMSFRAGSTNINAANLSTNDSSKSDDSLSDEANGKDSGSNADVSFIETAIKGGKDINDKYSIVLNTLCQKLELGQGAIYLPSEAKGIKSVTYYSGYAFSIPESETMQFEYGEGLIGQAAKEGEILIIDDIPDNYINIISGLGSASPKHLMILPILKGKTLQLVVELASFTQFSKENIILIKESFNLLSENSSKVAEVKEKPPKQSKDETMSKTNSTKSKKKKEEEN